MMLSHLRRAVVAPRSGSASAAPLQLLRRCLATDAAGSGGLMTLNFNLPQSTLYDSASVSSVIVPGAMGEYEVTAGHVPIVAELKAGMLTIKHTDGFDEKYFVPGGFSLTHEGSTTVSLGERGGGTTNLCPRPPPIPPHTIFFLILSHQMFLYLYW